MLHADQVEELLCLVATLDRPALIRQFQSYPATFPIDFTRDFLDAAPLDRLRHIFVAMCLQSQRFPDVPTPSAA